MREVQTFLPYPDFARSAAALAAVAEAAGAVMTVVSSDPAEADMLLQARFCRRHLPGER